MVAKGNQPHDERISLLPQPPGASLVTQMVKESSCKAGDTGSNPGSGRSPGGGHGNLQYYCLENPMDRGAWKATVHRVAESDTDKAT